MKAFPTTKKKFKQLSLILLVTLFIALAVIFILFLKIFRLRKAPPFLDVGSLKTRSVNIPCNQRTDNSGWEVKNEKLVTYPSCLTVMNSRFGSRFNFDWYFSEQKVKSSVMGTLEDKDIGLVLEIQNGDRIERIFPNSANSPFSIQVSELGLTYQKINFESDYMTVSLTIKSPFSPSKSADDESIKFSSAPFFYLEIKAINKNQNPNSTLNLTLNSAGELKNNRVYFSDPTRRDGRRVLANLDNKAQAFINGSRGGFSAPLSSQEIKFVYAGWLDGGVITDITNPENKQISQFNYIKMFNNINEVADYAISNYNLIENKTSSFEENLQKSRLTPEQKWLAAQAFHSYIGNTWLVNFPNRNDPDFFVWEGEFKYLNTVDVAHDYDVLAGLYFPWVIKSELKNWAESVKEDEFGKVIPHDLGGRFEFKGRQEYAIPGAESSGMPVEENSNFILLAYWYYYQTKDLQFLKSLTPLINDLCDSLIARDTNNNGVADRGIGMTTFDNDGNTELKSGPDNSYLAVKQLAAYLTAEKIFKITGGKENQQKAMQQAELIVSKDGPTEERSFFNLSGLLYPALTSLESPELDKLIRNIAEAYPKTYEKSLAKDSSSNAFGLQLAEVQTLHLGWFSHSIMADFISKKLFNQDYDSTQYWFPLLYDNPYAFADGQYFNKPNNPETTLIFYPRGAAIFSYLAK